jgi:hypothetical protein
VSCKQGADGIPCHWLETRIQIDGQFQDWDSVATSLMHKDHAQLKLTNDSQYLYLLFITDDVDWVRTIKMTGLTLYFNHNASRDKEFFVRYRNGPSSGELPGMAKDSETLGQEDMHPAMREQLLESERAAKTEFTCFVRDWIVEKAIPADGREGPAAAYGKSAGDYAYEFRIPLKQSEALYYGLATQPGALLGIGAAWGGMPHHVAEEGPPGGADFGGTKNQGSTLGEFGDPATTAPPAGGPPHGIPEEQEVWNKMRLATPDIAQP